MAQHFAITIEHTCLGSRSRCFAGVARVISWRCKFPEVWVTVQILGENLTIRDVEGQFLPRKLVNLILDSDRNSGGRLPGTNLEVILSENVRPHEALRIDPIKAREEFLSLSQDISALMGYLEDHSSWADEENVRKDGRLWSAEDDGKIDLVDEMDCRLKVIFPERVWFQQKLLREGMIDGPRKWLEEWANRWDSMNLGVQSKFPHFFHLDCRCYDAIWHSVTFDFTRDVKFAVCRRPDCDQVFEISHKGKVFCSQYCGHLVSVRKSRADVKKIARKKEKAGGSLHAR